MPETSIERASHNQAKTTVKSGIAAGIAAGIVLAVLAMIVAAVSGAGPLTPVKLMAATLLGESAVTGGVSAVLLGLLIHLFNSALLGVIFSGLISPNADNTRATVLLGVVFGGVVFLVMTWLILPWANPVMFEATHKIWFLVYHLVFGAALGLEAPIRRSIEEGVPLRRLVRRPA